jgi:dCMP deaminase
MRYRPPWDTYFLNIAKAVSKRSDCIRAKVGAVIVNERKKIKGTGYNNTPVGVEGCISKGYCYRIKNNIPSGTKYETCRSIHAEQNAIIQAGEDNCINGTIYIYGHDKVCILCKRFILNVGIKRVIIQKNDKTEPKEIDPTDWIKEL